MYTIYEFNVEKLKLKMLTKGFKFLRI